MMTSALGRALLRVNIGRTHRNGDGGTTQADNGREAGDMTLAGKGRRYVVGDGGAAGSYLQIRRSTTAGCS